MDLKKLLEFAGIRQRDFLESIMSDIRILEFGQEITEKLDARNTVFIGNEISADKIFALFKKHGVKHFVQRSHPDFFHSLFASILMIKRPEFVMQNPFPLLMADFAQGYAAPLDMHSFIYEFRSSDQKSELMGLANKFLEEEKKTRRLTDIASLIIDEFFMNAMFNAPVDSKGNTLFRGHQRNDVVGYSKEMHSAKLYLCNDDKRLLIACRDPFGSAPLPAIIDRFSETFAECDGVIDVTEGEGAGLGLKLIVENSYSYYMLIHKGKETLVCCTIPLSGNAREREETPKNIHFCSY